MRISSFLTFIIFCCLLFMEDIDSEEAAGIQLFAKLGSLHDRLKYLQRDIKKGKVLTTKDIDDKIENLINKVDESTDDLERAFPGGKIRNGNSISSKVSEAEGYLSRSTYNNSDKLFESLVKIENKWDQEIQTEVKGTIDSASS